MWAKLALPQPTDTLDCSIKSTVVWQANPGIKGGYITWYPTIPSGSLLPFLIESPIILVVRVQMLSTAFPTKPPINPVVGFVAAKTGSRAKALQASVQYILVSIIVHFCMRPVHQKKDIYTTTAVQACGRMDIIPLKKHNRQTVMATARMAATATARIASSSSAGAAAGGGRRPPRTTTTEVAFTTRHGATNN